MRWWPAIVVGLWAISSAYLLVTYEYVPVITVHLATVKGLEVRATGVPSLPTAGTMTGAQIVFWDEEHKVATRVVQASWIDFATGQAKDITVTDYVDGIAVGFVEGGTGCFVDGDVILRDQPRLWRK